ncbi:MAG TPA: EF-P beta-lysylation protein EpmB [Marinobacterium sp.]|nr:EF-P beta-lysylation protein EpmB [Marinobacterium sp.]
MQALNFPPQDWQLSLKHLVTEPAQLFDLLQLPSELLPAAERAAKLFPLRVPREFIALMQPGNINDPLLRQVLPLEQEFDESPGFVEDPLSEAAARPVPGVVHKYKDRVLLILSGACAINCRYCFRRHFPYSDNQISGSSRLQALDYIRQDTHLREVILSGGDPLATPDGRLEALIQEVEEIPHIERLRIHTRLPVVIPSRVTDRLSNALGQSHLNTLMVLHINHPQEISMELSLACEHLRDAGVTLLNQAVLLRGINDRVEIQVELSRKLFKTGILPYYLYLFDPVKGASHFDIPEPEAQRIAALMQAELPGYLMPRLAKEIPARSSKTLILPNF